MSIAHFNFPTSIDFGAGAIATLPTALAKHSCRRPLLVTDQGVGKLDFFSEIVSMLRKASINPATYTDTVGNPVASHVRSGVKAYKDSDCDSVVIIGGGAALDVGKAVALLATNPGDLFDYEDFKEGALSAENPLPYTIAIPTTAGTGSEVGRSSVISDDNTKQKKIIFDPNMCPDHVIADPELTLGLPASITAATGVDALTHNIEAYLATPYHPMCAGIALEGTKLVGQHLVKAVKEPSNIEARSGMLMASMMGAVAFQKGLGVTHSCAHALSTVFDLHHGLANALMLKACMEFNYESVPSLIHDLCRSLNITESGEAFCQWIEETNKRIEIPSGLGELGVEVTDQLVDIAFADPIHPINPRPVTKADFKTLFEKSM